MRSCDTNHIYYVRLKQRSRTPVGWRRRSTLWSRYLQRLHHAQPADSPVGAPVKRSLVRMLTES